MKIVLSFYTILFYLTISDQVRAQHHQDSIGPDSLQAAFSLDLNAIALYGVFSNQCIVLTEQHELIKVNDRGETTHRYNNKYFGRPQLIYSSNPLLVVLFYPSFQTIVVLDKTLSELKRIRLSDLNIPYVPTIGYSAEHEIWYYDVQGLKLKKVDKNGLVVIESPLISASIFTQQLRAIYVRRNELLIHSDSTAYVLFNTFGQIHHAFSCPGMLVSFDDLAFRFFEHSTQSILEYLPSSRLLTASIPLLASTPLHAILYWSEGLIGMGYDGVVTFFKSYP